MSDLLLLNEEFMPLVESGAKTSTIRRGHRAYRVGQELMIGQKYAGYFVYVTDVEHLTHGDLTGAHAERDGFEDLGELHRALFEIYGELPDDAPMTLIGFEMQSARPDGSGETTGKGER